MTITLTLEGVLLTAVAVAAVVLLIYLSILIKNLIKTLKKVDDILVDAQVVTSVAASKTKQLDGLIDDVSESVGVMVDAVKGNQSIVTAATNFVNAASALIGMVKMPEKKSKNKK